MKPNEKWDPALPTTFVSLSRICELGRHLVGDDDLQVELLGGDEQELADPAQEGAAVAVTGGRLPQPLVLVANVSKVMRNTAKKNKVVKNRVKQEALGDGRGVIRTCRVRST